VTTALADPAPGTIMKVTPPGEQSISDQVRRQCAMGYKIQLAQMGHLAAALKLTAAQKPVFESWRAVRLDLWRASPCPPLATGLEVPAPERIKNQITLASATLEALRKELPATQALYDTLTPEQRAIFDGPIKMAAPPPAAPPPAPAPAH
jgi:hypothetical protein